MAAQFPLLSYRIDMSTCFFMNSPFQKCMVEFAVQMVPVTPFGSWTICLAHRNQGYTDDPKDRPKFAQPAVLEVFHILIRHKVLAYNALCLCLPKAAAKKVFIVRIRNGPSKMKLNNSDF